MSRDRSTWYFVKTSGNWQQVQAEKTNNFPCPEENPALGIHLYHLAIKRSSTETAHVLSYKGWARGQDIHYWCQKSQKIMPVMPVGGGKLVFPAFILIPWEAQRKMPALQVNRHRNITEIFKRVSGQKSKDGKKHLDSVTLSMAKAEP